jgi:hypothetical protein
MQAEQVAGNFLQVNDKDLNVEDDAGFIAIIHLFDSCLMPGDSFDRAAQVMPLCIVGFA